MVKKDLNKMTLSELKTEIETLEKAKKNIKQKITQLNYGLKKK